MQKYKALTSYKDLPFNMGTRNTINWFINQHHTNPRSQFHCDGELLRSTQKNTRLKENALEWHGNFKDFFFPPRLSTCDCSVTAIPAVKKGLQSSKGVSRMILADKKHSCRNH